MNSKETLELRNIGDGEAVSSVLGELEHLVGAAGDHLAVLVVVLIADEDHEGRDEEYLAVTTDEQCAQLMVCVGDVVSLLICKCACHDSSIR